MKTSRRNLHQENGAVKKENPIKNWLAENADPAITKTVKKNLSIANKIHHELERKGLKPVDLAKVLGKNKLLINDEHVIIDKYKYDYGWIKLVEAVSPNIESSFYMVSVAAVKTESDAKNEVIKLENKGYQANYLWIPDYASLSGAKFYSVYIGPFSTQQECEIATEEYRKKDKNAYGLLVSQEPKRVQINGVGKVTVTNN